MGFTGILIIVLVLIVISAIRVMREYERAVVWY
jgi:regulator of protease activity HflC (stomatin/prohibitin superfamily)